MMIRSMAALVGAVVLALASPALAQNVNFKATLGGGEEVPPVQTSGKGELTATFDQASKRLTWKGNYSGLSGPATAAHFHAAEKGKNGGVAVPISPSASSDGRLGDAQRSASRRPVGGPLVREHPYRGQQGG